MENIKKYYMKVRDYCSLTLDWRPIRAPNNVRCGSIMGDGYRVEGYSRHNQDPRTYKAVMKRFHTFCTKYSVSNPFLLTEQTLCFFASYLAEEGLAPER